MLEVTQIAREIHESGKRLEQGSKEIFGLAKAMAETEQEYRRALGLEEEKLKLEGMQVTLIPDIARGRTAELKFKRDLAEARYKSGIYSLQAIQAQMSGLQSIQKYLNEV